MRIFWVTPYFVWQASSLNMAFVFQKVADFEEREDGSYECSGIDNCQTTMPPKPCASPVQDGRTGHKRKFEGRTERGNWRDSDPYRRKRKAHSRETSDHRQGQEAKNRRLENDEPKSTDRRDASNRDVPRSPESVPAAENGEVSYF